MGKYRSVLFGWLILVVWAGSACAPSAASSDGSNPAVRLGYFPNVTHAPAIVGVVEGFIRDELGETELRTSTFNAGPDAVEALFSDALDLSFIGPNPAINAYAQSGGDAIRIVSGSTSGGAALIVRPDIDSPSDLVGTRLATPQLGNTQDVALRAWLKEQGLRSDLEGGGEVSVVPQSNPQTLETFRSGDIDGAWAPEPWATRLVLEGGGKVLVDEADLWPQGRFVTTHLIVRTEFLAEHPDLVEAVLRGVVRAVDFANDNPARAQQIVNDNIAALTGSPLAAETMVGAWSNLTFTVDPIASSLRESAEDAVAVGLLEPVDLTGIYSLNLLNDLLRAMERPEVSS
ncbi:MAG TPA: ABC transporter substrate-binding protein [Acidimicrobiia bacterium]|nr:ABC transporter substrate-binding protein [Acidimicrobiia bacterium]